MNIKQKPLNEKEVHEEMVKFLEILLFHKVTKDDEERIKNHLRKNLIYLGELQKSKNRLIEQRKADAWARKMGVK